ncbi:MAG: thiamine pyrophosphate-dependent enzyme [Dehalococcoidia bacterium]
MPDHEAEGNSLIAKYLRQDRLPHIWCPACGIGPALNCFLRAIHKSGLDPDKISIVSGIGCSGRVAGYVKLDSFHTTHGRAIPFATGLRLANPELKAVVFSGDGDLAAIGGNHLIHAARRNIDMTVICINNFNYGMTGGQVGPTAPYDVRTSTTPYGNFEPPFNLPLLLYASGATYIARWTVLHLHQLESTMTEALLKPGFSFVEVISPCPAVYGRMNKEPDGLDSLKSYEKRSVIKNGADPREVDITANGPIIVGKFIDVDRPTLHTSLDVVAERAKKPAKK